MATMTTKHRVSPGCYEVRAADGTPLGRYGGRDGARWAQLADGTMLTEDSRVSVGTLRGLIEHAATAAALAADDDVCEDCGRPCHWDEAAQDYRHTEPGVTCFLITVPTPPPAPAKDS